MALVSGTEKRGLELGVSGGLSLFLYAWLLAAGILIEQPAVRTAVADLGYQGDDRSLALLIACSGVFGYAGYVLALLAAVLILRRPWIDTLGLRRPDPRGLLVTGAFLLGLLALDGLNDYLAKKLGMVSSPTPFPAFEGGTFGLRLTFFAFIVVASSVFEELFWRGVAFGAVERSTGRGVAIFLTSLGFALTHHNPGHTLVYFLAGLVYAFPRAVTRSVLPGVVLHALWNALTTRHLILLS